MHIRGELESVAPRIPTGGKYVHEMARKGSLGLSKVTGVDILSINIRLRSNESLRRVKETLLPFRRLSSSLLALQMPFRTSVTIKGDTRIRRWDSQRIQYNL